MYSFPGNYQSYNVSLMYIMLINVWWVREIQRWSSSMLSPNGWQHLLEPPEWSSYYLLCFTRVRKSPVRVWEEWRLELSVERVRLSGSSLWTRTETSSELLGLSSSSSSRTSSEVVWFSLLQWDPASWPQGAHSAFTAQIQASQSIHLSKNTGV